MEIRGLDTTDRRDVRRFIAFPFNLYRDCPQWVPPFVHEARAQLRADRHPFYRHSEAAFFLAVEGDQVLGRIAALDNRRHNEHHGAQTAFFCLFDSVQDRAVSGGLFEAACGWARGRGLDRVWGPKGFIQTDGQGILVEGFQHRPAVGIPYNYSYYGSLLEDAGFEKQVDFVSFRMDRQYQFPQRHLDLAEEIKRRRGFHSTTCRTKAELRALIPQVTAIFNESWVEVQGYTPVSDDEAQAMGDRILTVADPELISILRKGDELVGFVLAYPDLSAAIQRCRGRLWPTGWYHLLREFRRTRWINLNGAAILPCYRGPGGNALLYAELYYILIEHTQYDFADLVQVQETNTRMLQDMHALGLVPHKRHRIYQRLLS